ncbi:hypothetical protein G6031_01975 [Dietzia sp. CQ4]|uniref:hypothetical protein n=1 Tax=Dietzia sp. (strain CQ4) TaxID=370437 RepID=UPI0015FC0B11|nr:hypothetical protein [Dietzia sp. CQ4]MBB1033160.1 hypothetical protein [Dietzia sp. CQ4]
MSENDNPELKPDPASTRRRLSVPLVAGAAVLVFVAAGATYVIATGDRGADDPALSAAHATTEATESATSSYRSSSIAPQTSAPAPTTPVLLTGVPAAPTTSAAPARVTSTPSRGASAAGVNQYAPITSSYVRTTAVQSTTMPLPPEVVAAMDTPTTTTVPTTPREPAPAGQGGALVGAVERGDEDGAPTNVDGTRPAAAESGPGQSRQAVRDIAGTPVDDTPARPADAQQPTPEPAPSAASAPVSAPPAPAPAHEPVQEPVQAAVLDAAFRSAFTPGASDEQIAAAFESGAAMIPVGRALADGLPLLGGAVQWSLAGVAGVGDTATGQLVITTPLGTNVVPMVWVRHGEQWKIATESTCALGLALLGGCAGA